MKVVGINGSARKNGNTAILINTVFDVLNKNGIETELIQLAGSPVRGCMGCGACKKSADKRCIIKNDIINECFEKMSSADGFILGSPVYYADVSAEMKALIDRTGMLSSANGGAFKHKVGASVVALRRGGAIHAFDTMNHFLHMMQMYLVGASYWNMGYGGPLGAVSKDEEALTNMKVLGENMAWILKKIRG